MGNRRSQVRPLCPANPSSARESSSALSTVVDDRAYRRHNRGTRAATVFLAAAAVLCAQRQGHAQPILSLISSSPVLPGASITVTATLSGSSGFNIAGFGFTLPGGSSAATAVGGSQSASKTLWGPAAPSTAILLIGMTNSPTPVITNAVYGDGSVLQFNYLVPSSAVPGSVVSFSLPAMAANSSGSAVTINSPTFAATVQVAPSCVSVINANIGSYLANPVAPTFLTIVSELISARGTGTCQ